MPKPAIRNPKRAVYNAEWAENIFSDLKAYRPRATEFVLKTLNLTEKDAIGFLVKDRESWEILKKTIKMLCRIADAGPYQGTEIHPAENMSTFVERMELNVRHFYEGKQSERVSET